MPKAYFNGVEFLSSPITENATSEKDGLMSKESYNKLQSCVTGEGITLKVIDGVLTILYDDGKEE